MIIIIVVLLLFLVFNFGLVVFWDVDILGFLLIGCGVGILGIGGLGVYFFLLLCEIFVMVNLFVLLLYNYVLMGFIVFDLEGIFCCVILILVI